MDICDLRLIPAHAGKTPLIQGRGSAEEAHPRSRGENQNVVGRPISREGSSPLTRGKRIITCHPIPLRRLIPAHAGKTKSDLSAQQIAPAHPRSRGENQGPSAMLCVYPGSSPLTRGKREIERIAEALGRLIPAHAGKTSSVAWAMSPRPAHPRSRGENAVSRVVAFFEKGSSPLTRGKHLGAVVQHERKGLIPAHAGKTAIFAFRLDWPTAHPRSRGENLMRCWLTRRR